METARLIGSTLVFVSAFEAALFIVIYSLTAAWWRTPVGRHLAAFVAAIGLVLLLAGIRIISGGETLWFAWVRVVVFTAIPVLLGQRIYLLIKAQRAEHQRVQNGGEDDAPTE